MDKATSFTTAQWRHRKRGQSSKESAHRHSRGTELAKQPAAAELRTLADSTGSWPDRWGKTPFGEIHSVFCGTVVSYHSYNVRGTGSERLHSIDPYKKLSQRILQEHSKEAVQEQGASRVCMSLDHELSVAWYCNFTAAWKRIPSQLTRRDLNLRIDFMQTGVLCQFHRIKISYHWEGLLERNVTMSQGMPQMRTESSPVPTVLNPQLELSLHLLFLWRINLTHPVFTVYYLASIVVSCLSEEVHRAGP